MLSEDLHVRQFKGEPKRRWFSDYDFDLIVWLDSQEPGINENIPSREQSQERERIIGFQLCYDKKGDERALTWKKSTGYSHHRVDTGEGRQRVKATPVLVADSEFEHVQIAELFREHSVPIDQQIAQFVYRKIIEYQFSIGLDESH